MLARLLSTEVADDPASVDWVTLLRSCSGHEAFLRTYRREPEPGPALEFLLRERLFPRSILCALLTAEDCLSELDPGRQPPGTHDEARRLVAEARTHLEFRPMDDMLHELFGPLAAVQAGVSRATDSLATRYFRQTKAIEWHVDQVETPNVPDETSSVTPGDGATPLSTRPGPRGLNFELASAHRPPQRLPLCRRSPILLQRGAHHAGDTARPASARVNGHRATPRSLLPLLRLLGFGGPRLRPARPASSARSDRQLARRDLGLRARSHRLVLGRPRRPAPRRSGRVPDTDRHGADRARTGRRRRPPAQVWAVRPRRCGRRWSG